MICAQLAGIKAFVTGGIGGVHRGAETTMDVSADLQELAKTDVAVICAGAKSILDLGLTMEYLETQGVPVVGYQTDKLPSFFTRTSPFDVNYRLDTAAEVAEMMKAKWDMNLEGGMVIANPIPEEFAMEDSFINKVIDEAVKEAESRGITGKDVTPFLLGKIKDVTEGKSLEANIALVKNNAKVGAQIAVAFGKISQ